MILKVIPALSAVPISSTTIITEDAGIEKYVIQPLASDSYSRGFLPSVSSFLQKALQLVPDLSHLGDHDVHLIPGPRDLILRDEISE